jgi:ABC-type transport system substrate-binding protein
VIIKFLIVIFSLFSFRCEGAAAEPEGANVYHRILRPGTKQLDPAMAVSSSELQVVRQLYDQLVTYDRNFALRPMLAADWKISKDGRLYTFDLRKDVLFSDGTNLTAADVIFSLKRLVGQRGSQIARDLTMIKGAAEYRKDPSGSFDGIREAGGRIEIKLEHPNPYLLAVLASPSGAIVKKYAGALSGKVPVGTGPFLLECAGPKNIVLTANKRYFKGPPKLEKINYHIYQDASAMYKDFIDGRLDDMAPFSLPPAEPRTRFKRIFSGDVISYVLTVHPSLPPLDNKYVRQALAMAVDFDAIFKNIQKQYPYLSRSRSYIPKGRPGFTPAFSGLGYDPKKALELLRLAGYKDFADLPPVTLGYSGSFVYSDELVRGMSEYYSKAGLKFLAEKDPTGTADSTKWHMVFSRFSAEYPDSYFLVRDFHSREQGENGRIADKTLDPMIEALESGLSPAKRVNTLQSVNRHLVQSAYFIPLYSGNMFDGYFQKWVEGVQYPNTSFYDLSMYSVAINSRLAGQRPLQGSVCENE